MLQWMGGSRRKVNTSRKSTHKRQKQYFEQRKRQQHQTAGLESYADGEHLNTPCSENKRSLDILSLVNLTTIALEQKTRNLDARNNSDEDDFPSINQDSHHPPTILINEDVHGDQSEINDERASLSWTEVSFSKKAASPSAHVPDHNEDFVGQDNKLDPFKLSTTQGTSVIDLLGESGANINGEENSRHEQESHVAFSVEGLGKVEVETPVHSPKILCRYKSFPYGLSPPKNSRRHTVTPKHLDYDFDDSVVGFSPNKCSIEQPFYTSDVLNIFADQDKDFVNARKSSPLNWRGNSFDGAFVDDELSYNIRDRGRNFLIGPDILEHSFSDWGKYDSFSANWVDNQNVDWDDCYRYKDPWQLDFLGGWNPQKKWCSARTTKEFDMREPLITSPKHQIIEDLCDVIIPNTRYSSLGMDHGVKDSLNCFSRRKDTRDSLSQLSEESCASTAVRGDTTKKTRESKN